MTSDPPGRSQELSSQARDWAIRLRSGQVSQIDVDAFARWRDESPAHRRALAEINAQWDVLQLAARSVAFKQGLSTGATAAANRRLSRRAWLGGAMAASIGGAAHLLARPPLDLWPSLSELTADYRTDVGEQRQIAFGDKVSVEMNTRTSLAVTGPAMERREIKLIAGEIAVTAGLEAKPLSEPFVVVAGNGRTSAARATFDLRHDGQGVSVICLSGTARVECQNDIATLNAGQTLIYGTHGLGDIALVDGAGVEAWRRGLLVFDNKPLSHVVSEINRYRRGRIVLLNDEIGRLPLDATFRLDRIDEAVPKIAHMFALNVRALPGGVLLLS